MGHFWSHDVFCIFLIDIHFLYIHSGNLNIHLKRWHFGIKELPFGSPPVFDVKKTTFGKHHVGNTDAAEFKLFYFTLPTTKKKKEIKHGVVSSVDCVNDKAPTIDDDIDFINESNKCKDKATSDKEKFTDSGGVISKFRIEKPPKTLVENIIENPSTPPASFPSFSLPDGMTSSALAGHNQRLIYLPIDMDMLDNEYCVDNVEENGYAPAQTQVLNHTVITSISDLHNGNERLSDCTNNIISQIQEHSYLQNNELASSRAIDGLSERELDMSRCLPMYTEVIDHTNGTGSYFHEGDSPNQQRQQQQQQQPIESTHDDNDMSSITSTTNNCLVLYTGVIDHVTKDGNTYLHKHNNAHETVSIHDKIKTNLNVITSTENCLEIYGNKVSEDADHYFSNKNEHDTHTRETVMVSKLQQDPTSSIISTRNDCLGMYTEVIDHVGKDPYLSKNNSPQQQHHHRQEEEEGVVFPINNDASNQRTPHSMNVQYFFQDSPSADIQDGDNIFSKSESTVNPNDIMSINWWDNHTHLQTQSLSSSLLSSKQTLNPIPTVIKNVSGGEIRDIYTQPTLF